MKLAFLAWFAAVAVAPKAIVRRLALVLRLVLIRLHGPRRWVVLPGLPLLRKVGPLDPIDLDEFVERWVNYEFDLYTTPQGRLYLQLMMRLSTEAEVESQRRRDLDCAQVLVMKAFESARPRLDSDARSGGWLLASAALYSAIVRADEGTPPEGVTTSTPERRRTVAFIAEGLKGCWGEAAA